MPFKYRFQNLPDTFKCAIKSLSLLVYKSDTDRQTAWDRSSAPVKNTKMRYGLSAVFEYMTIFVQTFTCQCGALPFIELLTKCKIYCIFPLASVNPGPSAAEKGIYCRNGGQNSSNTCSIWNRFIVNKILPSIRLSPISVHLWSR